MWRESVDLYRFVGEDQRTAYGPYEGASWPRRHLRAHGGKGKVQKLRPVANLTVGADPVATLEWVDVD